jgi:hypothetical protein
MFILMKSISWIFPNKQQPERGEVCGMQGSTVPETEAVHQNIVESLSMELEEAAIAIQSATLRAKFYEENYRKTYIEYVKTSDLLSAALRKCRVQKKEICRLEESISLSFSTNRERIHGVENKYMIAEKKVNTDFQGMEEAIKQMSEKAEKYPVLLNALQASLEEYTELQHENEDLKRHIKELNDVKGNGSGNS